MTLQESFIRILRIAVKYFLVNLNLTIVNIFNSFTLIRTTLYLAHGPYLSLYNISEGKWLKHIKFDEGDILRMVKVETVVEG